MSIPHPADPRRRAAPARVLRRVLAAAGLAAVLVPWSGGDATALTADGWTTEVTASTTRPAAGTTVTLTASVEADDASTALVDVEVYDEQWNKVFQRYWPREAFAAGTERRFAVDWTVPAALRGELRVRVGVFGPEWGRLHHWNDDPLRLQVTTGGPTTTAPATTAPPTTAPPTTGPSTTAPSTPPPTTAAPTTTAGPTTTVAPSTTAAPTTTASPTTVAPTSTTQPPDDVQFLATFDQEADFYDRFQLDVHFRDDAHVDWGRVFPGDHDASCGAPTTQRQVRLQRNVDGANRHLEKSDLFWWCAPGGDATKGHIMTGMADVDGYTILSFAPNQSFTDVSRVCWDVNLTDLGGRKWTQVLLVPEEAFQRNGGRLDYISPVTQDVDGTAVPLPEDAFMFQLWDHAFRAYNPEQVLEEGSGWSTQDKARRYKHCMVDNGDGTITITQERDDRTHSRTVPGSFPDQARVIFQDDNYTPEKDGPLAGFTWHWDNILVD